MTVRTLSGATVTLVGRGANYMDGDAIIPSFVDADGTEYFLSIGPNNPGGELVAIEDGVLNVGNAQWSLPFEVDSSRCFLVNTPSTKYNATSALVFAKRCGITVSNFGLKLITGESELLLRDAAPICDSVFALVDDNNQSIGAHCEEGWGDGRSGNIGCDFQAVNDQSANIMVEACYPGDQWDNALEARQKAHNAWVYILNDVPESVFVF